MPLFQVTLTGTIWGQNCKNVLHFLRDNAGPEHMGQLAQHLLDVWIHHIAFTQTQNFTWNRIDVKHIDEQPFAPVVLTFNKGGQFFTGTNVWGVQCFVYQLKTASSLARRNRGRVYISGIHPELESGLWTASRINLMTQTMQVWIDNYVFPSVSSGFAWVITSRENPIQDIKVVTQIVPRAHPGTQVRRNLFRGN